MAQPPPPPPPPSSSPDTSFPILAISILGILTTAIFLLSYYIFVIKCCLNWHRSDVLRRLSRSRRLHRGSDPLAPYSAVPESRGLNESAIQAIPTFRFRGGDHSKRSFNECAVCLNEFQIEERIRMLPNCFHVFHIDCIDTWLQSNTNCPLCRSDITSTTPFAADQLLAEPPEQSGDIVIEMRDDDVDARREAAPQRSEVKQKKRSMGDECIDVRGKDEHFSVQQPIRRSLSMDSSSDRQLYRAVQEILQQNRHFREVADWECSSSSGGGGYGYGRARRHFFSFGHCRSSRSSVLPI